MSDEDRYRIHACIDWLIVKRRWLTIGNMKVREALPDIETLITKYRNLENPFDDFDMAVEE